MILNVTDVRAFVKEISRLNKRAHKVGFAPITYAQVGRKIVMQRRVTVRVDSEGEAAEQCRLVPVDVIQFDLNLPTFDWKLAATISTMDNGETFIDPHIRGFDVKPYQAKPHYCQHCNTQRHRTVSFVVKHSTDGRVMQVGRNCFRDYCGADGLAKLEFMQTLVSVLGDGSDEDFCFPGGGSRVLDVVDVRQVIALAEIKASQGGWQNNVRNRYTGDIEADGTHRQVVQDIYRNPTYWNEFLAKNYPAGNEIWAKVDAIIDEIRDLEAGDDDFAASLRYCLGFAHVPRSKASTVAYAGQFLRNRAQRVAFEAKKAKMAHVGTVGQREGFSGLTCKKVVSFDSSFGICYIHIFEDANGNELVWKTGQHMADEGEKLDLKATVKEHGHYKGVPQTVITRAKVA